MKKAPMIRAMAKDYSWKGSAKEYIKLFSQVLNPAQKRVI
jgi:glycogen synthase